MSCPDQAETLILPRSGSLKLIKEKQKQAVHDSICEVFELTTKLPLDVGFVIPTPGRKVNVPFNDGENFDPGTLWNLYHQAAKDDPITQAENFEKALSISGVAVAKLTQTLFLINPNAFLPIDEKIDCIPIEILGSRYRNLKRAIEGKNGYKEYTSILAKIRSIFPECYPYEINTFLYQQFKSTLIDKHSRYYQISTNVDVDDDDVDVDDDVDGDDVDDNWDEFNKKSYVFTGGPGDKRQYPLTKPARGDIILVRCGTTTGKAIGIVLDNDYAKLNPQGYQQNRYIHVVWINKSEGKLVGRTNRLAMSEAIEIKKTFGSSTTYKSTIELIDKLIGPKKQKIGSGSDLAITTNHPLNLILYGPPGTGKTYSTSKICVDVCCGTDYFKRNSSDDDDEVRERFQELRDEGRIKFVTFHQSFSYEEFVEGFRPQLGEGSTTKVKIVLKDGIFKQFALKAESKPQNRYILIIDEINRADISKVFGELITLIEEDKRTGAKHEVEVELPYSQTPFSLPPNLYIVGTMNTSDRSIALIDIALRRRFEFKEIAPNSAQVAEDVDGIKLREVFQFINDRLEWFLDRNHLVGHAWLKGVKSRQDINRVMYTKIVPLIAEYFHDDWKRVHAILGDGFIKRQVLKAPEFSDDEDFSEERYGWKIIDESEIPDDAYDHLLNNEVESEESN